MKIFVIGASQGIGLELTRIALEEGHEFTILLRNPSKLSTRDSRLKTAKGDILTLHQQALPSRDRTRSAYA